MCLCFGEQPGFSRSADCYAITLPSLRRPSLIRLPPTYALITRDITHLTLFGYSCCWVIKAFQRCERRQALVTGKVVIWRPLRSTRSPKETTTPSVTLMPT